MTGAIEVNGLGDTGRMTVVTMRVWVLHSAHGRPGLCDGIRQHWNEAGAGTALPYLGGMMKAVSMWAGRVLHFRPPPCGFVTDDEAHLVRGIALLQAGRVVAGTASLAEVVPEQHAVWALNPAFMLARDLGQKGLFYDLDAVGTGARSDQAGTQDDLPDHPALSGGWGTRYLQ